MANYSRRALAELIANGQDTSSAAERLGRPTNFIQKEQKTDEYAYWLKYYQNKTKAPASVKVERERSYQSELQEGKRPDPL